MQQQRENRLPGPTPCVGRLAELGELSAALDDALAGRGRLVLVAGEPGIGKTRLAEELAGTAAGRGVETAWGRSVEADGAPAFWAWRQVLAQVHRRAAPAALAGLGDEVSRLASLAPELAATSAAPARDAVSPDPAGERFLLFAAAGRLLRSAAQPAGLMVVLDDLHWADLPSLRLLAHVGAELEGARLLVVGTYRDTEVGRAHPLRRALADLVRTPATARIRLRGFDDGEVAEHLATTCGRRFHPEVVREIHARSGGNPFFVTELGRLFASSEGADRRGGFDPRTDIPEGVRDVVGRRLDRLSPGCQELLAIAATIGTDVDLGLLAAVAELEADRLLDLVDEATRAGLLTASAAGEPRRSFSHALIRDALHAELASARRARLHERIARQMEARHAGDLGPHLAELAHHWIQAAGAGNAARAAEAAERAGEAAMDQLAHEEAARLYGTALELLSSAGTDPRTACRLLIALAGAQYRGGDVQPAAETSRRAAASARRAGDAEGVARAALVLEGIGDDRINRQLRALCEEALAALPAEPTALRSRLLAQLAVACFADPGSEARMADLSSEALDIAERAGDGDALAAALRARQMASCGPAGVGERLAVGERMLQLGAAGLRPSATLWGHLWRFDALMELGRLRDAAREVDALQPVVEELRMPLGAWHLSRCRAVVAQAEGRFAEATAHSLDALATAAGAGPMGVRVHHVQMLQFKLLTGDDPGPHLDAITSGVGEGFVSVHRLQVAIAVERPVSRERARELYAQFESLDTWRPPMMALLPALTRRAELAAQLGARDDARRLHAMLRPFAAQHIVSGSGAVATFGSTEYVLGVVALSLGRADAAVAHLERAVESNRVAGMPPLTARAQCGLAEALARRDGEGDVGRALALVAVSRGAAERMGMRPLAERAARLDAELRPRTRRARLLTPREEEVAGLVAQGLTNREIAAALHLSERTAENHVQHILDKLGLRTRSQVAAWFASRAAGSAAPAGADAG